jgi:hypothetical protein
MAHSTFWCHSQVLCYFHQSLKFKQLGESVIQGFLKSFLRRIGLSRQGKGVEAMTLRHERQNDGRHRVEIAALKVLLIQEGDHWIAQGLDLDYAAAGTSIQDVKDRFSQGLYHTIDEHLKRNGSLESFIRPAPREVWQMYFEMQKQRSLETSVRELEADDDCVSITPFRRLAFLQPAM